MTLKTKVVLIFAIFVGAFALGRYSVPQAEVTTETKEKTDVKKQVDKDTKKKSTTTVVESPTGDKTTTTVVEEETSIHKDTTESRSTDTLSISVPAVRSAVSISALVGVSRDRLTTPIYGLQVSKEILGPITIGAFGMTNGVFGVSIGVNL